MINKNDIIKLTKKYDKLPQSKKNMILIVTFFCVFLLMSEYLLFNSVDAFNKANLAKQELKEESIRLSKTKQELYLQNAQKSENNLVKQKRDLSREVDGLLTNNKTISYVSAQKLPEVIGKIIEQVGTLSIIDFKNINEKSLNALAPSSILIKHSFVLEVSGSYQAIYDLLNKLKSSNIVHVSSLNIEKDATVIRAKIEFYIINTNKNMVSF